MHVEIRDQSEREDCLLARWHGRAGTLVTLDPETGLYAVDIDDDTRVVGLAGSSIVPQSPRQTKPPEKKARLVA